MFNPFSKKNALPDFPGGIPPPAMKQQSMTGPVQEIPLPDGLIIPLQQHQGPAGELQVKAGNRVLKGQPLTRGQHLQVPVHAPTSGIINTIEPHVTAHSKGLTVPCIHLIPDGCERAGEYYPPMDYRMLTPEPLLERIHLAGIVGLGGAGFPTAKKLHTGLMTTDTLIINAAESEPYVTADECLIQEYADEILQGISILVYLLQPRQTLIGIEKNKLQAIAALRLVLAQYQNIQLQILPDKYPSGSARQLTTMLTGREVPSCEHSPTVNVLMHNISTVLAIKRAVIDGQPLIERVITLSGDTLASPCNVRVKIGTPVRHLLNHAGFNPQSHYRLLMGGPLMGTPLQNLDVPVVKTSNCILALSETGMPLLEQPCIRCGLCADVCPAGLLPQQLYWFIKGKEHEKIRRHHLSDCIECGACNWVCPSHIPLVQHYRQEKATMHIREQEDLRSAAAKARFEARKLRLERGIKHREEHYAPSLRTITAQRQDTRQNAQQTGSHIITHPDVFSGGTTPPDNAQKTAGRQSQQFTQDNPVNPHKEAVAAAIARVQAKKT